ncbi:MAG: hypothetical protein WC835_00980 [Candidatus Paceibacterota bacterium]|jgi:hypothetical protein
MPIVSKPTQDFVPIKEIRDGIVVLKDGSMRMILMASSLNIALKSEDEQSALLFQFQNFLNSLDFSIQIFIQSRRLDIRPYIALLEGRMHEQLDDLLKIQTKEYMEFIKNLTETTNIMTKNFFIVVPYTASVLGGKGSSFPVNFGAKRSVEEKKLDSMEAFDENRTQLDQRASVVAQGMSRLGIRVVELGTEEAIELFYKLFNPGEAEKPISLAK